MFSVGRVRALTLIYPFPLPSITVLNEADLIVTKAILTWSQNITESSWGIRKQYGWTVTESAPQCHIPSVAPHMGSSHDGLINPLGGCGQRMSVFSGLLYYPLARQCVYVCTTLPHSPHQCHLFPAQLSGLSPCWALVSPALLAWKNGPISH